MRRLPVILGCVVFVFLAAIGAALLLVDVNQFRGPIQAEIERSLHRKIAFGKMGLKLVPLSIRVNDFEIAEVPSFETGKPFVSTKELYLRVGLVALLQKRLEIQSAILNSPSVELVRSKAGDWNFGTLGRRDRGSASHISLDLLRIENGTLAITDRQNGAPRQVYDVLALTLDDYNPGRKFTAEGAAHLPGARKEEVAFKLTGMTGGADLDGSFTLTDVTAGPVTVNGNGTLEMRGNAVVVKSSLQAGYSRLRRPLDIASTIRYDRASANAVIDPLEIRMDRLRARGKAEAAASATPMSFRADLRTDSAPVADLLNAAHALDVARDVSATGTASIAVHIEGKGDSLASSGHISGRSLVFDQVTLDDVESNFKLAGRTLHLDDIRAHAFGGGVVGSATLETGGPGLKMSAATKLSDVDARSLLAATTAVKVLSGKLSGVADLQFAPVPGRNAASGLNGTVALLLTGGEISGVRILDHLALLGRFLSPAIARSTSGTAFSKLAGTLRIQSGVARTDDLHLDFDGGALSATGTANLADETLDLAVSALLSKDVSQTVGGTRVGGFMTTVMASPKGELMIPAKVTGTFSKPHFEPDPARLMKMRFGSVNSAAATAESLLDQFTKPKGDKANPFSELMNALKPPAKPATK